MATAEKSELVREFSSTLRERTLRRREYNIVVMRCTAKASKRELPLHHRHGNQCRPTQRFPNAARAVALFLRQTDGSCSEPRASLKYSKNPPTLALWNWNAACSEAKVPYRCWMSAKGVRAPAAQLAESAR